MLFKIYFIVGGAYPLPYPLLHRSSTHSPEILTASPLLRPEISIPSLLPLILRDFDISTKARWYPKSHSFIRIALESPNIPNSHTYRGDSTNMGRFHKHEDESQGGGRCRVVWGILHKHREFIGRSYL